MKLAEKSSRWLRPIVPIFIFVAFVGIGSSRVHAVLTTDEPTGWDENCTEIAQDVFNKVSAKPDDAEDIIAYAVRDYPNCAEAIIEKGLAALPTTSSGKADPKVVESVLTAVLTFVKGDPELMDTVIQTVVVIYPEVKSDVPVILAGIFIDPLKKGDNSDVTKGQILPTPTPTPSPSAPATPVPVTPDTIQ
jgi:hypothetical protein